MRISWLTMVVVLLVIVLVASVVVFLFANRFCDASMVPVVKRTAFGVLFLFGGSLLCVSAIAEISRGEIRYKSGGRVRREEQPARFWLGIASSLVQGGGIIILAILIIAGFVG